MPSLKPLQVMISSVITPSLDGSKTTWREVRAQLANRLRSVRADDGNLFEVWLSEEQGALGQDQTAWEQCMAAARNCDIQLVLFTGRAGWVRPEGGIGICHAEWEAGLASNPDKVRVVFYDGAALAALESRSAGLAAEDVAFFDALTDLQGWREKAGKTDEVIGAGVNAVWQAVADLTRVGRRSGGRSRDYLGQSLQWANLDFPRRQAAMLRATLAALGNDVPAADLEGQRARLVVRELGGHEIAFLAHAVPGPFSLPEARLLLGQPFRDDLAVTGTIRKRRAAGPVHIIAIFQGVTEAQVRRFGGRDDALLAGPPFGYFYSDDAAFNQAFFLGHCRDANRIVDAVGSALDWLHRAELESLVVERAGARLAILQALERIARVEPADPSARAGHR